MNRSSLDPMNAITLPNDRVCWRKTWKWSEEDQCFHRYKYWLYPREVWKIRKAVLFCLLFGWGRCPADFMGPELERILCTVNERHTLIERGQP